MKVSIVMCSYNVESFIAKAIESILAQTYTDWELIIADDASTDATLKIIELYLTDKRIRLIKQPQNIGYVKNKNYAFKQVTGELITQLDSDDTCPPKRLEKQVNVFINNPEIQICGSNYRQIDQHDKPLPAKEYPSDYLIHNFDKEYPFWFPGLMFRANVLKEFGLFSEYFSGLFGDDNYWTIRVNNKYPIYFLKDILYNYRINPNSITNVNDNPRKLIVGEIIGKLREQQKETKTDWLEQGMPEKLLEYEKELLSSKELMAVKYRIWAAKALDKNNTALAWPLLKKSFELEKTDFSFYKTLWYYFRVRFSQSPSK